MTRFRGFIPIFNDRQRNVATGEREIDLLKAYPQSPTEPTEQVKFRL